MVIGLLKWKPKCQILTATHHRFPAAGLEPRRSFATNAAQLVVVEEESSSVWSPEVDSYAYARAFKACIAEEEPGRGKAVHCHALKRNGRLDLFCRNILLHLYVKFDLVACSRRLFDEMPDRNMVSFVTLIQGHAKWGNHVEAAELFLRLHREDHELNHFVFTTALKLFVMMDLPDIGHCLHASIFKLGHDTNSFVGASLIEAYSLCGLVDSARMVFDEIRGKDIVLWTGMVSCYSENECADEALILFSQMMEAGFRPNNFTLTSLLKASVFLSSVELGKSIHGCAVKAFYESDPYVGGALLDMYAKCGDVEDARLVFNLVSDCDVILWSFMISRYAQSNQNFEALDLFQQMVKSSVVPNEYSFSSVLQACASMGDLNLGRQFHDHVTKIGLDSEIFVANALMDVYAKCNDLEALTQIFFGLCQKNDVSWNTIIVGHVQLGHGEYALSLFNQMRELCIPSTQVTYSSALRACASIAAFQLVGQIHALVLKSPYNGDNVICNSLVDSYAKCGNIRDARKVFDFMKVHDVISWNSLISGYAIHGLGNDALSLFRKMIDGGIKANGVTFVGVLTACSNMGLVNEGQSFYYSMTHDYGIEPTMEHYTCMVRLFGRSGKFDEALDVIKRIPLQPSATVWRALLGACLIHKNVDLGKLCAEKVLEMEPEDELTCVLLSNLYASVQRWDGVSLIRSYMRTKQVKKEPGVSWIENQGMVHYFTAGDVSHPDMRVINAMLEWLNGKIRKAGYVPDGNVVLHDVGEKLRERLVWVHSERLALAFGLVSIPQGCPIRIIKNLRFCSDCHASFKLISKVIGRELIVRDMNRFHHFQAGICSCADYCFEHDYESRNYSLVSGPESCIEAEILESTESFRHLYEDQQKKIKLNCMLNDIICTKLVIFYATM
ncbi:Putative pentatricopeptide repeat-containing protein [Apostasia shenzhenica]|uniref:Pentatricopeptide repeat-containing protein n=1 Tax=Apostasia shenzhenica TaxID=1088818 RepID=A0A2I0B074_9ASPA|nr:Putative pentatricopeptide repeat-containing protein [Apostasia shenzhenica]